MSRTRLRWAAALVTLLTAVGLVGCGSDTSTASHTHPVVDGAGRTVEVPDVVNRIVTIGSVPVLNSFPFAVGAGDAIVNGMPPANAAGYRSYTMLAPRLLTQPAVQSAIGNDFDREKVLAARPDVVLTSSTDIAGRISSLGIPAVVLSLESGDKIEQSVLLTGRVLGREKQAQAYVDYFDRTVDTVRSATATVADQDRPSVLYVDTRPLRRPNRVMEWMFDTVGAKSVTHGVNIGQYPLQPEQILAWDPDVLIGMQPHDREDLRTDPRLSALRAVRENRVSIVPTGIQIWGNNTAEQPLGLLWVAKTLYPDRFANVDLVAQTRDFYHQFFGIDLTDQQIRGLLDAQD